MYVLYTGRYHTMTRDKTVHFILFVADINIFLGAEDVFISAHMSISPRCDTLASDSIVDQPTNVQIMRPAAIASWSAALHNIVKGCRRNLAHKRVRYCPYAFSSPVAGGECWQASLSYTAVSPSATSSTPVQPQVTVMYASQFRAETERDLSSIG